MLVELFFVVGNIVVVVVWGKRLGYVFGWFEVVVGEGVLNCVDGGGGVGCLEGLLGCLEGVGEIGGCEGGVE